MIKEWAWFKPQFSSMTIRQWLGKTKLKIELKYLQKVAMEFKKKFNRIFY